MSSPEPKSFRGPHHVVLDGSTTETLESTWRGGLSLPAPWSAVSSSGDVTKTPSQQQYRPIEPARRSPPPFSSRCATLGARVV